MEPRRFFDFTALSNKPYGKRPHWTERMISGIIQEEHKFCETMIRAHDDKKFKIRVGDTMYAPLKAKMEFYRNFSQDLRFFKAIDLALAGALRDMVKGNARLFDIYKQATWSSQRVDFAQLADRLLKFKSELDVSQAGIIWDDFEVLKMEYEAQYAKIKILEGSLKKGIIKGKGNILYLIQDESGISIAKPAERFGALELGRRSLVARLMDLDTLQRATN